MVDSPTLKRIFDSIFEPAENLDEKPKENEAKRLKAEDFLYEKKKPIDVNKTETESKENIFVDYNFNNNSKENNNLIEDNNQITAYEPSQHISPIFGVIDSGKKSDNQNIFDHGSTKKPSSYLGGIISPYFGYDTSNKPIEEKKEEIEEFEDFDITEDLGDIFSTDEFKQELKDDNFTEEIDLFSDFNDFEDK